MTDDHHDPVLLTSGLLAVGIVAVSFSGPIAAATAAPALAVAFWRNALGAAAVLPWAATRRRAELARVLGSERGVLVRAVAAGLVLAVHFGLWIPSLRLTSVTAATALVTTAPLFTMVADRLAGRRVPPAVVAGVLTSVAGVLVITGVDATTSQRALTGDLLALGGVPPLATLPGAALLLAGLAVVVRAGASSRRRAPGTPVVEERGAVVDVTPV